MVLRPPGLPLSGTVLILDICRANYSHEWVEANWARALQGTECPCCRGRCGYARHAVYQKYHYAEQIEILRVRCRGCRVTHAIMPSFSLPDTSIGTREAEAYLKGRASGQSRAAAGRCLLERGLSGDYPRRLERMLEVAVSRGKALWPRLGEQSLQGLEWMQSLCGATDRPLLAMNLFALAHGVNALCFSRPAILLFARTAVRRAVSLKRGTVVAPRPLIDSA